MLKKDKRSLLGRVKGKTGKITTGSYSTNAVGYNPNGKNPGDVVKDLQEKRGNKRSGMARLASHEFDTPGTSGLYHKDGKNPGDFWNITTQPFTGYNPELEHFAVFPEDLVLKPLKASCPKEICKKCGKGFCLTHFKKHKCK